MASLFCRVAASFPSWRARASFILPGSLLIPANPSSNKRSLYLLAAYLSSVSLVFTSLQLDVRWVRACSWAISDSRPFLSACGATRNTDKRQIGREGRGTGCFTMYFRNARDWLRSFRSPPVLDFDARVPGMCLPTWFDVSYSIKRIAKFTDALFNCVVTLTLTQWSNNRLPPKTRYKLGSSALRAARED